MTLRDYCLKEPVMSLVGFEQYAASHLIENYICKYTTKGGSNSDNLEVSLY